MRYWVILIAFLVSGCGFFQRNRNVFVSNRSEDVLIVRSAADGSILNKINGKSTGSLITPLYSKSLLLENSRTKEVCYIDSYTNGVMFIDMLLDFGIITLPFEGIVGNWTYAEPYVTYEGYDFCQYKR